MDGLERNGYSKEEEEEDSYKKKKKKVSGSSSSNSMMMRRCCQVEKCNADLQHAKQYHKRHKVCEYQAKAQVVLVAGTQQRFCQQCSRFHEFGEFDETKRSCRGRLAGHNERRRKNSHDHFESQPEGSSSCPQLKVDDKRGIQITSEEDAKHFHI